MIRNRDYISWSQYDLFQKSPREYWKKYALNEDRSKNKFFDKGKEFADAMDSEEESENELLNALTQVVPKLDIQEYKITTYLSNDEKIFSILDSCSKDEKTFYEYKTGKEPWTQIRAEKHEQLLFYALSLYIKNDRKFVPSCKLIWIETEEVDKKLVYTGLVEEFEVKFTASKLDKFELKLIKTISDIEDFIYEEHELDEELVSEYLYLLLTVKEAESRIEQIRDMIAIELDLHGMKYGVDDRCKFSLSETKKYYYSPKIMLLEKEQKYTLSKLKKEEVDEGVATFDTTKTLRFSLNKK